MTLPVLNELSLPLVIDVDVALLLQQALANATGAGENATIFEICARINADGLDATAVITALTPLLDAAVDAQLALIIGSIINDIADIVGEPLTPGQIAALIGAINEELIVADIIANVNVSLAILEACLGIDIGIQSIPAPTPSAFQLPTVQQLNPTIQQNSQVLPSGDSILQLH